MSAIVMPVGLGAQAQRIWDDVTTSYQMRPDELRILEDACREVDLIEAMQTSLPKSRFTARGSMGQTVAHPLLSEIRQHRGTLATLLKQLKLTDLTAAGEQKPESEASTHARKAAIARWGNRG